MSFICLWRSFYISKGTPSACLTNVRLCGYCFLLVQTVAPPATPYWWLEAVREDWLKRSDSKSRSATSFFGCNVHHLLLSCATSVAVTLVAERCLRSSARVVTRSGRSARALGWASLRAASRTSWTWLCCNHCLSLELCLLWLATQSELEGCRIST